MNINTTDNTCFKSIQKVPFAFIWIYLTPVNSGKMTSSVGRNPMKSPANSQKSIQKVPIRYSKSPSCTIRNPLEILKMSKIQQLPHEDIAYIIRYALK